MKSVKHGRKPVIIDRSFFPKKLQTFTDPPVGDTNRPFFVNNQPTSDLQKRRQIHSHLLRKNRAKVKAVAEEVALLLPRKTIHSGN